MNQEQKQQLLKLYREIKTNHPEFSDLDILRYFIEVISTSESCPAPEPEETVVLHEDLEREVTTLLTEIGVPAHIKGFNYLRTAIILCIQEPEAVSLITKYLYPTVAKQYGSTSSRVERAIRHAIETAWNKGNIGLLNSLFSYSVSSEKGKATNGQFIALIADRVRLKLSKN